MIAGQRVVVIVPARDEEASLPGIAALLPRAAVDELVVADNGSRDQTARVAFALGATVVTEPRRGYGGACLAAIRHLSQRTESPDIVVFMDADWNGQPADVDRLVMPIVEKRADLVIGARTREVPTARVPHARSRGGVPWHARTGNRLVLALVGAIFGFRFQDLGPFRAIRFSALLALEMDDRDWGWTLQMQIRAASRGLRVLEVPVAPNRRTAGRSKISGSVSGSLRAGAKMLYTIVRERVLVRRRVHEPRMPTADP
ncbi:MAG: glycosyltransferase family 2 protein [Gemmatimonadetes bacterium]|nr:glycosyltransferase family 2 protein [Gemmatimonadota bacterium]